MSAIHVRHVVTERDDVRQVWEALALAIDEVSEQSLGLRAVVSDVEWSGAGDAVVDHRLGRQPQGWMMVDLDAAVTVYRSAWDSQTITLVASGAASGKVLVW